MIALAATGYALVSVSFLVLIALLLTSWRGQRVGTLLIVACSVSAFWAALLAAQTQTGAVSPLLAYLAETARPFAWVIFLVYLAGQIGVPAWLRQVCIGVGAVGLLAGPLGWLLASQNGVAWTPVDALAPAGLGISLCGLLLIEQLYRNTTTEARWGIKALAVGLGGVFVYDLFLYSQALLFGALDSVTWLARGWANTLFVPALAVAARRSPDWQLRIFVSRQVVFYTTTLVAVGIYLLLMSLGGFLLLHFGGSWGALARAVFFVGAAVVLAALLSSSTLRARTKVFLNKHFFQNKYDYRDEWLRLVSTLSEFEGGRNRGVAVKAIAQIVESPSGVLWMLDEQDETYARDAEWNCDTALPDIDQNDSLVRFVERTGWVIDVDEYGEKPGRYDDLELPEWLSDQARAWLLIPLMSEQRLVGLVMLTAAPVLRGLNYEDRDLLKTAGNHIAVHLIQAKSESLLSEARQFETYNRLTAFLMHDLNNLIAQQSLIVSNAEKHRRNPQFVDDAIATIANSVERMKGVMEQLRQRRSEVGTKRTELRFLASTAIDRCADRRPAPELRVAPSELLVRVHPGEFVSIVANLIKNAQEATPADGHVVVSLASEDDSAILSVEDSGSGMSEAFVRQRLFKPFDSTKGSKGMGIGVYHAREYARRIGGSLDVRSAVGEGTTMTLRVPLAAGL